MGSQGSETDRSLSPSDSTESKLVREIKEIWSTCSMILISGYHQVACSIHERCDGSCQGSYVEEDPPVIRHEMHIASMLMAASAPQSDREEFKNSPRNAAWVAEQDPAQHTYEPIESKGGEIRLLKIKRAVFRADVVECEIMTIRFAENQQYHALSYCWGTAGATEVMLCDGQKRLISPRLQSALKAYRQSPLYDVPLWVDATSIDQANKVELGEQIVLMRQIYTQATLVFVHLGEAELAWFQAEDLMFLLYILFNQWKSNKAEVEAIMGDILPALSHPCWQRFIETFSSPWYRRTWILQEIALAREAQICNGHFGGIPWIVIESAYRFFTETGLSDRFATSIPTETHIGLLNFRRILQIKNMAKVTDDSPLLGSLDATDRSLQVKDSSHATNENSLMEVLDVTHRFEVTNPRDRVVGVLGLVGPVPDTLKSVLDYNLSTEQVYQLTAIYLVETGYHDILGHAGLQRHFPSSDLPSWVPDWDANHKLSNGRPLTLFRPQQFESGGSGQCKLEVVRREGEVFPKELQCRGICYQRIVRVSTVTEDQGLARLRLAKECYETTSEYVYDDTDEAFARTLLVDDLYTGVNAVKALAPIRHLMPTFRSTMGYLEERDRKGDVVIVPGSSPQEVRTFIRQMGAAISGRRFAVTDSGHMCLVADSTQVGDAVAYLVGVPVPYTARLTHNLEDLHIADDAVRIKLVGDCYVHGMMSGEAFQEGEGRARQDSEIIFM